MFGLHLRDEETGVNLELCGSVSLVATLGWYCVTVLTTEKLAGTTIGFGLAEAYVLATTQRAVQILVMKWARRREQPGLEHKLKWALSPTDQRAVHPKDAVPRPEGGRHRR
jgi:hypothetical protein